MFDISKKIFKKIQHVSTLKDEQGKADWVFILFQKQNKITETIEIYIYIYRMSNECNEGQKYFYLIFYYMYLCTEETMISTTNTYCIYMYILM